MMKKNSITTILALGICAVSGFAVSHKAFAADDTAIAPVAVWSGDFGAEELLKYKSAGIKLVDKQRTHGEGCHSVTIDQDSQGLFVDFSTAKNYLTVLVKYSNLEASETDKRVLFATTTTTNYNFNRCGIRLLNDGKIQGLWNSSINSNSDSDYGNATEDTIPSTGTFAFIYDSTTGDYAGGLSVHVLGSGESSFGEALWKNFKLKSGAMRGFAVGGSCRGVELEGVEAAKGMTIEAIAVFDRVLSVDQMNAYEWPVPILFNPETDVKATSQVLRISEIMPKPTDDQDPGEREGMDVNGLESGWVEVENTSETEWADLADYRFIRVNRGKKTDPAGLGNFPSRLVPPSGRAIFYTSERYSNSKDKDVSAFAEGTFDGKPTIFENYGNILVWGDKVNPKKSPYVRLYYAPVSNASNIVSVVDTVVIPSDLPEGWSIIVGDAADNEGTRRWMCHTPTRGMANTATDGLTRIGPNVGPLYEKKGQKKTEYANEFAVSTPPAVPGTDYVITLPINPVMNPAGVLTTKVTPTPRNADKIQSIKFVYRKDLDDTTLVTNDIDMAAKTTDANWGDQYTATIPSDYFPAAGHLMQWKVLITDSEGVEWTSPSFNNKDDGYEWYGTIVEAPELESANLPTWHMFAAEPHLTQMDKDKDDQDLNSVPNYARIAIYDSSTSNYYDYVRIDLRGNTSAGFTKKGHGLRFAKAHPLTMVDSVTGETIEEIRKTSLISEFADPSYMRQMIAFWLWRKMGNLVPFDFPVRCNLNGEFYQLAFNSERFTDELIEDVYGLDKFGYGYKNVGTMKSGSSTTAGNIEKKTPDDEDESNITVLENELRSKITAAQSVKGDTSEAKSSTTTDTTGLDNADLTKFVVQKFDLPAWINYLASARITQEMDDVWANVCAYYDNPDMLEGARGKGTWMPLGYDFNLTFGQWYYGDIGGTRTGLTSNQDWYKSHPFYGGNRVRCWKQEGMKENCNFGNDGFEAVWQSAKFRRLYLRRLRTLMDQELKEPGTSEDDTPFMVKMREMAALMESDAALDQKKWPNNSTDDAIDVWTTRPATMDAGIQDIWDNYVVPRREHLYVTHSVTNTAKAIGYGSNLNAGIPEAQSPVSVLAPNIELNTSGLKDGVIVVSNSNDEVVDMSGWRLALSVEFTFPVGTVCDANDVLYIVCDRRTYVEVHKDELTDQVIIGNAEFNDKYNGPVALYAANGTCVAFVGIGEYVDAPQFDWQVSGDATWYGEMAEDAVGGSAARSGAVGSRQKSVLSVTLEGAGTLSFDWCTTFADMFDSALVMVDGEVVRRQVGEIAWTNVTIKLGGSLEPHEISWIFSKGRGDSADGAVWLDNVIWTPSEEPTLRDAIGDFEWETQAYDWESGIGNLQYHSDWAWKAIRDVHYYEGGSFAIVTNLGNYGVSILSTTVEGPGRLVFNWAVSCEDDYDWFDFTVDGEIARSITGTVSDWTEVTVDIEGEGEHVLEWIYSKDSLDDPELVGANCAMLDYVRWYPVGEEPPDISDAVLDEFFQWLINHSQYSEETSAATTPKSQRTVARNLLGSYASGKSETLFSEFVTGTNPEDPDDKFNATIEIVDGKPVVSWDPVLDNADAEKRVYTKYGKVDLNDEEWTTIDNSDDNDENDEDDFNFFYVTVEMK